MATMVTQEQDWTPPRIARWLRKYREWKAELQAGPATHSFDYSQTPVMGGRGGGSGGAPYAWAAQAEDLERRVRIIDRWLGALTPLERTAVDYWLDDGNALEIAAQLGLDARRARWLVNTMPLIIWAKFYDPANKRTN
jgi:hypothetical protein